MRPVFFRYFTDIDPALYTPNFSLAHLLWLTAAVLLIIAAPFIFRRWNKTGQSRVLKALVIFLVAAEAAVWLWKLLIGHYDVREALPLHLCSISVFVEFFAVFLNKPLLKEFSYALSMPSALAALITPGWYYPILSFQYLLSALSHVVLVLVPVLLVLGGIFRPEVRRLPKVSVLFIIFIALAVASNLLLGSNYMFLGYVPPDTALVVFQKWLGNPGYMLPELLLLLLIWTLLYLPWTLSARRKEINER